MQDMEEWVFFHVMKIIETLSHFYTIDVCWKLLILAIEQYGFF